MLNDTPPLEARAELLSPLPPTPRELVQVARGFTAIFWGLPLSLILFFNAVEVQVLNQLRMPSYLIGAVIILVGFVKLSRVRQLTPAWNSWSGAGLLLSAFLVYLAPFVYWWQHMPFARLYIVNMVALLIALLVLLFAVNRQAGEVARACGDTNLTIEARLCAWSVVVLMLLPFVIALTYAAYTSAKYDTDLGMTMRNAHREMPFWIHVFFLLPFSLTMTSAWKAKERSLKSVVTTGGAH